MTRPTRFEDEASDELVDAATWYETQRSGLSDTFLGAVEASLVRVGEWPEAAPLVGGLSDLETVRSAPVRRYPYRIIYVVHDEEIRVLAVAHNRREPRYWQGRLDPSEPAEQSPDPI